MPDLTNSIVQLNELHSKLSNVAVTTYDTICILYHNSLVCGVVIGGR